MVSKEFDEAKSRLSGLKDDPGNDAKLKIYALFKQTTVGPCNTPKPGLTDFVGRAKWKSWAELGKMTKTEAEKQYIDYVNQLCKYTPTSASSGNYSTLLTSIEFGNVFKIVLNRPAKKNAFSREVYYELKDALDKANADENVFLICLTGAGEYFTSGNDLSQPTDDSKSIEEVGKERSESFRQFVDTFIDLNKPIIGLVNGPAVGLGVTLLGLFDLVYASDKATFQTPFTKLALIPEACSSYIFPLIMGNVKATEVLLYNRKLTAVEACERNLVNEVIPSEKFQAEVWKRIEEFSKLPKSSMLNSRQLMRSREKETLKKVNKLESEYLAAQFGTQDFMDALMSFFQRKSKL